MSRKPTTYKRGNFGEEFVVLRFARPPSPRGIEFVFLSRRDTDLHWRSTLNIIYYSDSELFLLRGFGADLWLTQLPDIEQISS